MGQRLPRKDPKNLNAFALLALKILPLLAIASTANGAMVLYYNFDNDTAMAGSDAINSGTLGNGTYTAGTNGGTSNIVVSGAGASGSGAGNALQLVPNNDTDEGFQAPHINANAAASAFGFVNAANSDYTAMAWINFANQTGNNYVFGQGAGNRVHLGSRTAQYFSGHWGDDLGAGATDPGTWHHVAWTHANDGIQEIFVDGISIGSGANNAPNFGGFVPSNNLLIGTSGANGSFNGQIDEVKVFDTLLTQAEIQAASVIPEPTAAILSLLGAAGLLLRRRV